MCIASCSSHWTYFRKKCYASLLTQLFGHITRNKTFFPPNFLYFMPLSFKSFAFKRLWKVHLCWVTLPEINTMVNHAVNSLFRRSRTEWSNFLNRSPERFNIKIPELPSEKDQRFVGYAVRYLRPEVTRSWKVRYFFCIIHNLFLKPYKTNYFLL